MLIDDRGPDRELAVAFDQLVKARSEIDVGDGVLGAMSDERGGDAQFAGAAIENADIADDMAHFGMRKLDMRRALHQSLHALAEPETVAGEHVATLSQAIRRELTSMGDGVERAIARAAELETRVKAEVSTLERSYSDNERKIRSLIAEMADQREAIVANGGRVRAAISRACRFT